MPRWRSSDERYEHSGRDSRTGSIGLGAAPTSHPIGGLSAALGRYDEADVNLAQSPGISNQIGGTFFVEHLVRGDSEQAITDLTAAQAVTKAHGYQNVERRSGDALQFLGGRVANVDDQCGCQLPWPGRWLGTSPTSDVTATSAGRGPPPLHRTDRLGWFIHPLTSIGVNLTTPPYRGTRSTAMPGSAGSSSKSQLHGTTSKDHRTASGITCGENRRPVNT